MALQPQAVSQTTASQALVLEAVEKQVDPTNLLTSGEFSDLTIICGEDCHKVHKNIVGSRSQSLKMVIQNGKEGPICLDHEDPETVKRLVQYLYTGDYEPKSTSPDFSGNDVFPHTCPSVQPRNHRRSATAYRECTLKVCAHHKCGMTCRTNCDQFICFACFPPAYEHLPIHSKMYDCAENYGVLGLKGVSKKKFKAVCGFAWNNAVFAEVAAHVFSTTPDSDKGLRDIIAGTICEHPELLRTPEIQGLVKEFKSLSVGIIERKLEAGWNR